VSLRLLALAWRASSEVVGPRPIGHGDQQQWMAVVVATTMEKEERRKKNNKKIREKKKNELVDFGIVFDSKESIFIFFLNFSILLQIYSGE